MSCPCTTKDPDAWRWYGFNWEPFLSALPTDADPVTVSTSEWFVVEDDQTLTLDGSTIKPDSLQTAVLLKNGKLGKTYEVVNRVGLTNGGIEDYTLEVTIVED